MRRPRKPAQRLRAAVELLPRHTREAMLRGMDDNEIIVGAYTDRDGGICPMLAAHRNGGRTNFISFAHAWDAFTGATRRSRRATRREVRALRGYIELSLLRDEQQERSVSELAAEIRAERAAAPATTPEPATPAPRKLAPRLRIRRLRIRRSRDSAELARSH